MRAFLGCGFCFLVLCPALATASEPVVRDRLGDPLPPGAIARLGKSRIWHQDLTEAVFSYDGTRLFTVGDHFDGIRVWEVSTGKLLAIWGSDTFLGRHLALTNNGKVLVSCDRSNQIHFRDADSGKALQLLDKSQAVLAKGRPIVSPTGDKMAVENTQQITRVFDLSKGVSVQVFKGCSSVDRILSDGETIATRQHHRWSPQSESPRVLPVPAAITGPHSGSRPTTYQAFSRPDGKQVFFRGEKEAMVVDVVDSRTVMSLSGHKQPPIGAPVFSQDNRLLVTSSLDSIRLWDLKEAREQRHFAGGQALCLSRDGKRLAVLQGDPRYGVVVIHDLNAETETATPAGHVVPIWSIAASPDGKYLATSGFDKTARLWDARTGAELQTFVGHEEAVYSVTFAADGLSLFTAGLDSTVREWNLQTGKGKVRFQSRVRTSDDIYRTDYFFAVATDCDGRWLAASNSTASWIYLAGKLDDKPKIIRGHGTIYEMAFSPRGLLALAGPVRDGVRVIDPADPSWSREFAKSWGEIQVNHVAFSPDGNLLATSGNGLRLWDVESGQLYREFKELKAQGPVAYAPDGRTLVVINEQVPVLCDVANGFIRRRIGPVLPREGKPHSLTFLPGSRYVAVGYADGTALVWDTHYLPLEAAPPLDDRSREALWDLLGDKENEQVHTAIIRMIREPVASVSFIEKKILAIIQVDQARIEKLIRDLDDNRFTVRERATRELIEIGISAKAALEKAKTSGSEETQKRATRALESIQKMGGILTLSVALQASRAVEILEHIGTAEARKLLRIIAEKDPDRPLGQEAKLSLRRLEKK